MTLIRSGSLWTCLLALAACNDAEPAAADAGAADAATDPIAASLAGLRWEMPCASEFNEGNCNVSDPAPVVATLGGATGATYRVTLRFRGVVETKAYTGGTTTGFFNAGGVAAEDGFNVYELAVSDPPQSYFLNAGESGVAYVFGLDYTATVPMAAGATVTLTAAAVDGVEHKNLDENAAPIVVAGVAPAPDAYDGQFVQMDVEAVVLDESGQ